MEQHKLCPVVKWSHSPPLRTPCWTVQDHWTKAWENKKPSCPCQCAHLWPEWSLGCFACAHQGKGPGKAPEPSLCRYFLIAWVVSSVKLQCCRWQSTAWLRDSWKQQKDLTEAGKTTGLDPLFYWHWWYEEMRPKLEVTGAEVCRCPNPPLGFLPWRSLCVSRKGKSPWEGIVCHHGGWVSSRLNFSSFPFKMLGKKSNN